MEWFYLALLAGAFYSALALFQRHLLKKDESDPFAYSFFFSLSSAVVLFPFFLISPTTPDTPLAWGLLILMAVFVASQNFLSFTATKYASPSVKGVVDNLKLIWVLVLGLIFAYETWSALKGLGIGLTVCAGVFLVSHIKKTPQIKGVLFAFSATFFYAAAITSYKPLLEVLNPFSLTFFVFLLPIVINFFFMENAVTRIWAMLRKYKGTLIIIGFLSGGANLAIISALASGEASRVLITTQAFLIVTLAGEALILGEREHMARKSISAIVSTIGAILVRVAK